MHIKLFVSKTLRVRALVILAVLAFLFVPTTVSASSNTLNFQSKIVNLVDGTNIDTGTPACVVAGNGNDSCDFRVNIFDASSGGNLLFSEDHTDTEIGHYNGIFNLEINSVCNVVSDTGTDGNWTDAGNGCISNGGVDFSATDLWIEIEFDPTGTSTFSETFSRVEIRDVASARYAVHASYIDGYTSGDFVFFKPNAVQTTTSTNTLINLETTANTANPLLVFNENGAGTPDLLRLQNTGNSVFTVANDGRVGVFVAPTADTALRIESALQSTYNAGNYDPLTVITTNDTTGGRTYGVRSVINTGAANAPGSLRALRGEILYSSSGSSAGFMTPVSAFMHVTGGTLTGTAVGLSGTTRNTAGVVGTLQNINSFAENLIGGTVATHQNGYFNHSNAGTVTGRMANHSLFSSNTNTVGEFYLGTEIFLLNGPAGFVDRGMIGIASNVGNEGIVDEDFLGIQNLVTNSVGGTVNQTMFGLRTQVTNDGTILGDLIGYDYALFNTGTVTGNTYGYRGSDPYSTVILNDFTNSLSISASGDVALNGGVISTTNAGTLDMFASNVTTLNFGRTGANGTLNLMGGDSDTGCTLNGVTGDFSCTGTIIGSVSGAFFEDGGNSFGGTAVLGTNDTFNLEIETDGSTAIIIDTNQDVDILQALTVGGDFYSQAFAGFGINPTSTAFATFAGASVNEASLNIDSSFGTDVAAPNSGDLWWNGTELFFYDGTSNVDLLGGGVCATCFEQGGNSFGAAAVLGTNDTNALSFETNGVTRATFDTANGLSFGNGIAITSGAGTAISVTTGTTGALTLDSGTTGAVNLGTNANAKTITIGNVTGATGIVQRVGTGNFSLDGVGGSTYSIGASTVAGTITVGGTAQTGTMTLGSSSAANIINLGTGTGATTINIGNNNAGAINVGTSANAQTITIGSTNTSSTLIQRVGTGNFSLDGVGGSTYTVGASTVAGTITIGGTAQTGTMTLGSSSAANIINLGTGTGATTINIGNNNAGAINVGTSANAKAINIGNATGATNLNLDAGTGGVAINTATTGTIVIQSGTTGAVTFDSGTTGAVNIGTNANAKTVSIGSVTGASVLNLNAGTGGMFIAVAAMPAAAAGNLPVCWNAATGLLRRGGNQTQCNPSSARYKHNIVDIGLGIETLNQIRPVSFTYNSNNENSYGFIAEEMAVINELFVTRDEEGIPDSVDGDKLLPIIIYGIQQLDDRVILNTAGVLSLNNTSLAQNGNSFGAPAVVGTNDNNTLSFETNGVTRATFNTANGLSFANGIAMTSGAATAISITTGTTGALTLDTGTTGTIDIGTNANAKTVNIGSITGASALNLRAGTGGILIPTSGLGAVVTGNNVLCRNNTSTRLFIGASQTACNPSSARYKHDIIDISLGIDAVRAMRPVSYTYNETNELALGFIAEDMFLIDPRLVVLDEEGLPNAIDTDRILPILTKGLQQVDLTVTTLQTTVASLQTTVTDNYNALTIQDANLMNLYTALEVRVAGLESRVLSLENGADSSVVGEATILTGTDEIEVTFTSPMTSIPVIQVTPIGQNFLSFTHRFVVTDRTVNGFKIKLDGLSPDDFTFGWAARAP